MSFLAGYKLFLGGGGGGGGERIWSFIKKKKFFPFFLLVTAPWVKHVLLHILSFSFFHSIHSIIVKYSIPNALAAKQLSTYHAISLSQCYWQNISKYTWNIPTSHYCLQCIMVGKGSPHLKDFYLTLLSSMHYGEQRKPSLERFLPHIIVFNALW